MPRRHPWDKPSPIGPPSDYNGRYFLFQNVTTFVNAASTGDVQWNAIEVAVFTFSGPIATYDEIFPLSGGRRELVNWRTPDAQAKFTITDYLIPVDSPNPDKAIQDFFNVAFHVGAGTADLPDIAGSTPPSGSGWEIRNLDGSRSTVGITTILPTWSNMNNNGADFQPVSVGSGAAEANYPTPRYRKTDQNFYYDDGTRMFQGGAEDPFALLPDVFTGVRVTTWGRCYVRFHMHRLGYNEDTGNLAENVPVLSTLWGFDDGEDIFLVPIP